MSAFEKQEYIPSILWYQNNTSIFTEIELSNYQDTTIDISENHFSFTSFSKDKTYKINFELYKPIKNHKIQYNENNIKIVLEKEEDDDEWPRLTQVKNMYKQHIKIHWTYWNTEDEEEENDNMGNFDMAQMMNGMNGNQFNMEEMMKNMSNEEEINDDNNDNNDDNDDDDNNDDDNNDDDNDDDDNEEENQNETLQENEDDENKQSLNEDLDAAFDNSHSEELSSCSH